jgi:hypothetical protein
MAALPLFSADFAETLCNYCSGKKGITPFVSFFRRMRLKIFA